MVKREPIGKDRRSRQVTIARKGVDSIKENPPSILEISNTAMPSLSQEEMEELNDIMRRIRRHLLNLISDSPSKE
jgi:DNA-binding MarR family transcriptional regulator